MPFATMAGMTAGATTAAITVSGTRPLPSDPFYFGFPFAFRPRYYPYNGYGDCFRTWDGYVVCPLTRVKLLARETGGLATPLPCYRRRRRLCLSSKFPSRT